MKHAFGVLLIALGIAFGLYACIWWAFIGGIVDVINQIRAEDLSALAVATGVAKVIFSGLIGYASAALLVLPGYALLD